MSEQGLDEKVFKICRILNEIAENLKSGNVLLKDLLITKQLAKNPEEYKDAQGLYHVQVALRMNKGGSLAKKFRNGDTVSYLFCTDALPHHLSELAAARKVEGEDVAEVTLTPDPNYYLAHQIHPVVSRICEPIEGLDPARIAEALGKPNLIFLIKKKEAANWISAALQCWLFVTGMDATAFKRRRTVDESEDKSLGQESEAERYADCEKFCFKCPHPTCRQDIRLESLFVGKVSHFHNHYH